MREPASTAVIDEGGTWRKPGPILRGEALGRLGKILEDIVSPGRMTVPVAIMKSFIKCLYRRVVEEVSSVLIDNSSKPLSVIYKPSSENNWAE